MPRLLSVLPSDLARTRGGAERYAFELHAALAEALPGWDLQGLVVASEEPGRHVPAGWSAVDGRAGRRRSSGDAIGARCVLGHLRAGDVVVAHQWRTRATTALRFGARLRRGARVAVIDHGAGTRVGYLLGWIPFPQADVGAHQSEFEAAISPIRARRHIVIRGGVDQRRFRAPADGTAAARDFLMVGRFLPYKGQLRFLECLPHGARALLIGPRDSDDPEYRDAVVAKAAELGVPIRFDVSDEELIEAYQTSRHTVQVPVDIRRYEGAAPPELLGLTMLEAMACGSVPICPATGASAEFVRDGHTGRTYEAGSADGLSRVLLAALDDDGHGALRTGALAEARRWTWAHAARELVSAVGGPG
ncbi:MAG TPA: glycosyltransferase family 4 protein [Baekduia sp.]|nr:glycosyltransferase family 4 protein [Baekduia sp.]